jgi:hypothetical protein
MTSLPSLGLPSLSSFTLGAALRALSLLSQARKLISLRRRIFSPSRRATSPLPSLRVLRALSQVRTGYFSEETDPLSL